MHFIQLRRARFFGHGRTSDCADEQIFRCVAQVNKFQQLSLITHACQQIATDRVGGQCGHTLLYDSVVRKQGECIGLHLLIQFMLAAGHGKDHVRVPADRVVQCIVCGSVAGMERHHQIHVEGRLIAVDIAQLETQMIVAVFLGGQVAFFYDISLQVQANDLHRLFFDLCKSTVYKGLHRVGI